MSDIEDIKYIEKDDEEEVTPENAKFICNECDELFKNVYDFMQLKRKHPVPIKRLEYYIKHLLKIEDRENLLNSTLKYKILEYNFCNSSFGASMDS